MRARVKNCEAVGRSAPSPKCRGSRFVCSLAERGCAGAAEGAERSDDEVPATWVKPALKATGKIKNAAAAANAESLQECPKKGLNR